MLQCDLMRCEGCQEAQPWQQDAREELRPQVVLRRHASSPPDGALLCWVVVRWFPLFSVIDPRRVIATDPLTPAMQPEVIVGFVARQVCVAGQSPSAAPGHLLCPLQAHGQEKGEPTHSRKSLAIPTQAHQVGKA
jgi:hypothetical protein